MLTGTYRKFGNLLAILMMAVMVAACGGDSGSADSAPTEAPETTESASETDAPAEAEAAEEAPEAETAEGSAPIQDASSDASGANIAGKVTYAGEAPPRRPLETEGDPACAEMHMDGPLLSDTAVIDENGGVHWAFVYIKDAPDGDYPVPDTAVELDQVGCRYTPHVMGMRAGQNLDIRNSDETTHNVRSFSNRRFDGKIINKTFNFGQPGPGVRTQVFENPEDAIKMKCDIHPWMQAFIFAMEHPFFATSNADGSYALPTAGLPDGEYTLVVWHEKLGESEQTVTVAGGNATADFEYAAR